MYAIHYCNGSVRQLSTHNKTYAQYVLYYNGSTRNQMRIMEGLPVAFDAQGMFTLDNALSFGAGYRNGTALVGLLNLKVFEHMSVGYAYDFGVSSMTVGARHSHEIVISLVACDDTDPYTGPNGRCSAYD